MAFLGGHGGLKHLGDAGGAYDAYKRERGAEPLVVGSDRQHGALVAEDCLGEAGRHGAATGLALVERGVCRELVFVDRNAARAAGVALDMSYAAPLSPVVDLLVGDYDELAGAQLIIITAGVNEKTGGATDRSDPQGRLRLLETNAEVFRDVVPKAVEAAPEAVLMVVTDPPDPLADLARDLAGHGRVFSTGTLLDSLRFRVHLGQHLGVRPRDVNALVLGEHGVTEVLLWSSATVGGIPVLQLLRDFEAARKEIEEGIRFANINIIQGTGASQYGIGADSADSDDAHLRVVHHADHPLIKMPPASAQSTVRPAAPRLATSSVCTPRRRLPP